jgi:lactoylglutathione lyase
MVAIKTLATCLAIYASSTQACIHVRQEGGASTDFLQTGSDGPADAETLGWNLNHFSLIVRNLSSSMDFYGRVLGMRHIFTANLTPFYSVTYMGHAHGGANGTGFQTGEELLREKNNARGMIEFQYFADSLDDGNVATTKRANTFSHIGLIVPDLAVAQERMEREGVTITKKIGLSAEGVQSIANAFGAGEFVTQSQEELDAVLKAQEMTGFNEFLIVEDPDGNLLEVQQQNPPPGVL